MNSSRSEFHEFRHVGSEFERFGLGEEGRNSSKGVSAKTIRTESQDFGRRLVEMVGSEFHELRWSGDWRGLDQNLRISEGQN